MAGGRAEQERRLLNRLTAIKLAQQILERRTELAPRQKWLVRTALEACDDLTHMLMAELRPNGVPSMDGWDGELTLRPGRGDRVKHRTEDRLMSKHPSGLIDVIVVAPDTHEREAIADVLASRGYVVRGSERIDRGVEQLLAERRRLVVLSPDPDVGQAEIEAQARALRATNPNVAVLVCLGREQAPRAVDGETMTILRRPFSPQDLLRRAAELYPAGPPRRLAARRLLS